MRRALILPILLVALAAAPAPAGASRGTAVGVGEREFTLTPYRTAVPRGAARFNVQNFGEDGHDLAVVDPKGRTLATSPEVRPGDRYTLKVTLKRAGTYRLLCTLADHAARGMRAKVRVKDA